MSDEIIATEAQETGLSLQDHKALSRTEAYRDIARLEHVQEFSGKLKEFIHANKLTSPVGDKEWVRFEGWQFAGLAFGLSCHTRRCTRVITEDKTEIMYEAEVFIKNMRTGEEVANVIVLCSNKEPGKARYQAFAISSMAQTRGGSKAYRSILAFIMHTAGFEVTPAEEMDAVHEQQAELNRLFKELENKLYQARTENELTAIYQEKRFAEHKNSQLFKMAFRLRREQLLAAAEIDTLKATAARLESVISTGTALEESTNEAGTGASVVAEVAEKPATTRQKAEILLMLNNQVVTAQEKEKMVSNINKLSSERADKAIEKLKKIINDRQNGVVA